jgi:D-glycero-alpha-D-manno-heptose 1-phosphate guanylyltransferase
MATSVTEAIILAGGLGTRLQAHVPDLPKCLAPVAGLPFIDHVIGYLQQAGINRFVFSLGYRGSLIENHIQTAYPDIASVFVVEDNPLGTGGAIQLAGKQANSRYVAIINGDTLFKVNLDSLSAVHQMNQAVCTLALKPMNGSNRYGSVTTDVTGRITHFAEKKWQDRSLINGGIYILDMPSFLQEQLVAPFSFETDYLAAYYQQRKIYGQVQDTYFIDIGVPADYERAGKELNDEWRMMNDESV